MFPSLPPDSSFFSNIEKHVSPKTVNKLIALGAGLLLVRLFSPESSQIKILSLGYWRADESDTMGPHIVLGDCITSESANGQRVGMPGSSVTSIFL